MIITIIGAGNAGSACAFMAAEAGHKVRLLKTSNRITHDDHFEAMVRNKGIYCIDNTKKGHFTDSADDAEKTFQPLELITRDPKEAIEGADVVMIFIQTTYHRALAERIAKYFQDDQLVILIPGYAGSIFYNQFCDNNPIFAEGESTPNDARVVEPGTVKVLFKNVRNSLSFFPATRTTEGMAIASRLFPAYNIDMSSVRKHIFESALHNPNIIVHTVGQYVMYPMLEYCAKHHPDEVPYMYRDALSTEMAWQMIEKLDAEKMAVLSALGCEPIPYLEACLFRNEQDVNQDPREVFESYKISSPPGPDSFNNRYITEDVPMGLVLLSSLGETLGINTPECDRLIEMSGGILARDFYAEGRTLASLGLGGLTREELLHFVERKKVASEHLGVPV
ncbi:NAD/NADP octopine/nopaline dehydrogenase family protein [Shewanella benthica]|uniref:NAD/NADP-dependent octopine/nopaline dehydrogenase family protein n=1 Tax=Shewanella benthica TaxID=43661 RepID=UPI00187AAAF9|nr:NAD/NADP-dependent octopine/nopaline dehydrogenase family protein [Shewanella benthica]MBE7215694.1 NAD/NADP octopine/nopaline dehydrogenase family protein [Shewanella benthica]MCL1062801.1 NAD/NADP octopine/nopaline dehydrogenase family protein [Shewanella benthica]